MKMAEQVLRESISSSPFSNTTDVNIPSPKSESDSPSPLDLRSEQDGFKTRSKFGYIELAEHLAAEIREGKWPSGCSLPSTRALAHRFQTGPKAARLALKTLSEWGLIEIRSRAGARVRKEAKHKEGAPLVLISGRPIANLMRTPEYRAVFQGIASVLEKGQNLTVIDTSVNPDEVVEQVKHQPLGGILLLGMKTKGPGLFRSYSQLKVPVVLVDEPAPSSTPLDGVLVDNVWAAAKVTRRLLELGHRRMAFIGRARMATAQLDPDAQERAMGFREACAEAGQHRAEAEIIHSLHRESHERQLMHRLLTERPRPTAVLCTDSILAQRLKILAEQHGLSVPKDLSIACFHGESIASEKTDWGGARIKFERLGAIAGQLILNRSRLFFDPNAAPAQIRLKPAIVDGKTIGARHNT